ncbi:hypothetical protein TcarDRAFT_0975 [Thermosinus carboxydivorans Nor1]|uniref:Anti-sigma-F factor Fin family protein n=1 Tax=Thermosinus carboxydivorans Nor1 TaxID=401526 RepID=A1HRW5_9FIRM|nr:anti-sigma-F factor Fin [Thermosinus carboxydivorans]EAX47286.1 hypothetical protein TcarDRAFT_0975 [Thermosinus carboxydivorans Nor1]
MKIFYTCDYCGQAIDTIEVDQVDEARFGFDCLTAEERETLIRVDSLTNTMFVQSLCDACIERLGLDDGDLPAARHIWPVH